MEGEEPVCVCEFTGGSAVVSVGSPVCAGRCVDSPVCAARDEETDCKSALEAARSMLAAPEVGADMDVGVDTDRGPTALSEPFGCCCCCRLVSERGAEGGRRGEEEAW